MKRDQDNGRTIKYLSRLDTSNKGTGIGHNDLNLSLLMLPSFARREVVFNTRETVLCIFDRILTGCEQLSTCTSTEEPKECVNNI